MTSATTFSTKQEDRIQIIVRQELIPTNRRLDKLETKVDSLETKVEKLEKEVQGLKYTVVDHTSRLDRMEERLGQTLTKDFFLEYMDPFVATLEIHNQELHALSASSMRHEDAIEIIKKASTRHSNEIQLLKKLHIKNRHISTASDKIKRGSDQST